MSDGGLQQAEGGHLVLHPELHAGAPAERVPGFAFQSTRVHRAARGDRQLIQMPAIIGSDRRPFGSSAWRCKQTNSAYVLTVPSTMRNSLWRGG
jgi:hypothetical protein